MAVAETAKSSGKASGSSHQTKTLLAACLQALFLLPFGQAWSASQSLQGLQASGRPISDSSALSRSQYEGKVQMTAGNINVRFTTRKATPDKPSHEIK